MIFFLNIMGAFIAYLLGTLPVGLWVTSRKGAPDLQNTGSGNIGATNVLRVFGKKAALLTLTGDIGKGMLAVFLMAQISSQEGWQMTAGFLSVLGHTYPVFRKGKGGKGVATGFGVLLSLDFMVALTIFILWITVVLVWRISSLGAIVSFSALPLVGIALSDSVPLFLVFSICLSALILFRHAENLKRIGSGKEPKIGAPK